jgi:hypothetical protein
MDDIDYWISEWIRHIKAWELEKYLQ